MPLRRMTIRSGCVRKFGAGRERIFAVQIRRDEFPLKNPEDFGSQPKNVSSFDYHIAWNSYERRCNDGLPDIFRGICNDFSFPLVAKAVENSTSVLLHSGAAFFERIH